MMANGFVQLFFWAIGGWLTGLIMKSAGIKLKGGYLFLMLLGWGLAGILGMVGSMFLNDGNIDPIPEFFIPYGLIVGMVGGFVTIRQIAKARKKQSN